MAPVTEIKSKSECELIAECRHGDNEAITELFARHYPACLNVARGILHCVEESQDAVQSAYISAFRHLHTFRGESSFKTWMTRLVINQCRMVLRKPGRRFHWVSLDDPDTNVRTIQLTAATPTPERFVLSQEISSALADAMARLPQQMREIFTLCVVSGFTVNEAAAVLGLTRAAAKTRLFRAHVRMRSRLKPLWQARQSIAA